MIDITIINWDKYNPRKDRKKHSWLRLDNDFFYDHKIFKLTPDQRLLFLFLLCEASKQGSGSIKIDIEYVAHHLGGRSQDIPVDIQILEQIGVVLVTSGNQSVSSGVPTNVRTNDTYERTIRTNKGLVTFESITEDANRIARELVPAKPSPLVENVQWVIARYCDFWKERYGTNPPISGKVAGQVRQLVKDHGATRTQNLIEAYLKMPDSWFVTKRHDIATMITNLNAVAQFLDTGKMLTKEHVRRLDQEVDKAMGPKPPTIQEILAEREAKTKKPGGKT